jgi:hypothetical protein
MRTDRHLALRGKSRSPHVQNSATAPRARGRGARLSKRTRIAPRNEKLPFAPPEDWYEPTENGQGYRIIVQSPGAGYRHVLTPDDVRRRLAQLPPEFLKSLEVVQFSRMTRKKRSLPCYGLQWGTTLYLYPIEENLVEQYHRPPKPSQQIEARMYGGRWEHVSGDTWRLTWTESAIRDFYLNNILIHELGHLVDDRNANARDRERYAEWFAVRHGYQPTRRSRRPIVRRHG